jgi:hypothetical protein
VNERVYAETAHTLPGGRVSAEANFAAFTKIYLAKK